MSNNVSIESQVVIKATTERVIAAAAGGVDLDFASTAEETADALIAVKEKIGGAEPAQVAPPAGGGAATPSGYVKIKNPGNAPEGEPAVPDWLAPAAAAEGVTEVWDNRKDLPQFGGDRNPKSPWFKAPNGTGIWPPRKG